MPMLRHAFALGRRDTSLLTSDNVRLLGLTTLCAGLFVNFGSYQGAAIALVVCAVPLMAFSCRAPEGSLDRRVVLSSIGILAVAACLGATRLSNGFLLPAAAVVVVALAAWSAAVSPSSRMRRAVVAAAAAALVAALIVSWHWGELPVDSAWLVRNGARDLLSGVNPYTSSYAAVQINTQGSEGLAGMHFPYGPSVLLFAIPFALAGDVRLLAALAVVVIAACVVTLARRANNDTRRTALVTALALAFPLTIPMAVFGWTADPLSLAGFAVWLVLRERRPAIAAIALGIGLAAKPTTIAAALLPFLLWSPRARLQVAAPALVAGAICLPFVLITGFGAWYQAVAGWFANLPVRIDGLTLNTVAALNGWGTLPWWAGIVSVACTAAFVVRRPRGLADVLTQGAVLGTVGLLFAKWAYLNYYAMPALLLLLALAAGRLALDGAVEPGLPRLSLLRSRALRLRSASTA